MACSSDSGIGGVQVVFRELATHLEEQGIHVHLVNRSVLPAIRLLRKPNSWGREAYYCPMPGLVRRSRAVSIAVLLAYLPVAIFHLARLIRREKVDVINCHYLTPHFIHLVIAARLLGVPIVVSVHGADVDDHATADWAHKVLTHGILRGATRVVACSQALASQVVETFPETRGKVTWVHNGLRAEPHKAVQELVVPSPFLLCVSRHVHKKGIDILLRAFALVCKEMKQLSLVLVGDGPLLSEHKILATRLQIERQVLFVGEVAFKNVPSYFAQCTVYVLPSRSEPFGLVLLEAADYGKPIVCTRVGGVPEIITDGVDGVIVEPDDPASMAAEILTILRDGDLGRRLGNAARETLVARFLWKERIRDYIEIFQGSAGPSLSVGLQERQSSASHDERVASADIR